MRAKRLRAASTTRWRRSSYLARTSASSFSNSSRRLASITLPASSSPSVRVANTRACRSRPEAAATVPSSAALSRRISTCAPAMRSLAPASTSTSPACVRYSSLGSFSIALRSASASVSYLNPSLFSLVLTQSNNFWKKVGSACMTSSASAGFASSASMVALKMSAADEPCSVNNSSTPSGVFRAVFNASALPLVSTSSPSAFCLAAAHTLGAAAESRCMVAFHACRPSLLRKIVWNASCRATLRNIASPDNRAFKKIVLPDSIPSNAVSSLPRSINSTLTPRSVKIFSAFCCSVVAATTNFASFSELYFSLKIGALAHLVFLSSQAACSSAAKTRSAPGFVAARNCSPMPACSARA